MPDLSNAKVSSQVAPESLEQLQNRHKKLSERIRRIQLQEAKTDFDLPPLERIQKWGYRAYVGGSDPETWYGIGKHQYHYLALNGLKSHHRFLDIACGSLRLGQYLIPFLDDGNYFGIEGEEILVKCGIENEILPELIATKKPNFSFNYDFDFAFIKTFDVAIAQSLFTHLTIPDISKCFVNLRPKAIESSKFYFTYFEGDSSANPDVSHASRGWKYSVDQLSKVAEDAGWKLTNIGEWGHPRNQKIAFVCI